MNIDIRTIPHKEQRYETIGDYYEENGILHIRVSNLGDWRYEILVIVHELVEWSWCKLMKIDICDVDTFDIEFEENRKPGDDSEPGDEPDAPYFLGHQLATGIERTCAAFLGVIWKDYELACNRVSTTLAHKS